MPIVDIGNIGGLIERTLDRVDPRLVDHGKRVAYLTVKMLDLEGTHSAREKRDVCFLALLHDVGAYKTDEINQMLQFETTNIWAHSIYGYLFLRHLSPIASIAPAVLFHHTPWKKLAALDTPAKDLAQIISLADRVDVATQTEGRGAGDLLRYLKRSRGNKFSGQTVDLFLEAEQRFQLLQSLQNPIALNDFMPHSHMSRGEIDAYLTMLVYSIDFRSQHTVTHTITTTGISDQLAILLGFSDDMRLHVHYGALLHDLGKIGIPVEILEYPGKLSPQAMSIMRTHVNITQEILNGAIDPVTTNIALRHHEKLNGSGYPRGLCGDELTVGERIVAVADMASALLGTRSYKEAYSKDRALRILRENAAAGLVDADVVGLLAHRFDEITGVVSEKYAPVLAIYQGMSIEYQQLHQKYAGGWPIPRPG